MSTIKRDSKWIRVVNRLKTIDSADAALPASDLDLSIERSGHITIIGGRSFLTDLGRRVARTTPVDNASF